MAFLRVLVADDTSEMLEEIAQVLCNDFDIIGFAPGMGEKPWITTAMAAIDLVVLNITMPRIDGFQLASKLRMKATKQK